MDQGSTVGSIALDPRFLFSATLRIDSSNLRKVKGAKHVVSLCKLAPQQIVFKNRPLNMANYRVGRSTLRAGTKSGTFYLHRRMRYN